jgi:hypothetical protein
MTSNQKSGQIRAMLTALSGVLVAWGISDGHGWMPIIGMMLATVSLLGGILAHRGGSAPGGVAWSLVRKTINATGAALVTYGITSPEQAESVYLFTGALGPLLASAFSWIDNDEPGAPPFGGFGMIFLLLAATLFLPSCTIPVALSASYDDPETGAAVAVGYSSESGLAIEARK